MEKNIYTDLALEAREMNPAIDGVLEDEEKLDGLTISRIEIKTNQAAEKLEKPMGHYVTLDAPGLVDRPLDLFARVSESLSKELGRLFAGLKEDATVLIVGLGNRGITSDSLGPKVAEQVFVTRHVTEYMPGALSAPARSVCAVAPGVLGITGIETMEIIRGITEHLKPDLILAIDSLASRRAARISTTIQLTDTGINPGSGVGNTRKGLNAESFGIPVFAVGVPLVVYATTISQDTISLIADETGLHQDEEKLRALAEKVSEEHLGAMVVTPKDVDQIVQDMSRVLADGINMALFEQNYEEVRMLVT